MHWTVPNIVFIVIIGALTIYLTFATTKGSLTNNAFKGFWKRLTTRGKSVFIICVLMLILLILQEWNNQRLIENHDYITNIQNKQRDSTITVRVDSGIVTNRKMLFDDLSFSFKEQNLKIDTLDQKLIILKDSIRQTVNTYSLTDPIITLDETSLTTGGDGEYHVRIFCADAGATNFKIDFFILSQYTNAPWALTKINILQNKELKLPAGGWITLEFRNNRPYKIENLYFYLVGSYSNTDQSKIYPIDNVYCYFLNDGIITVPGNTLREYLKEKFKELPIEEADEYLN